MGDTATLTRPSGTLSHPMGEGRLQRSSVVGLAIASGTLSHRMGEGRGEGPGVAHTADCSVALT